MFALSRNVFPRVSSSNFSRHVCGHCRSDFRKFTTTVDDIKAAALHFEDQNATCAPASHANRYAPTVTSLHYSLYEPSARASVRPNQWYRAPKKSDLRRRTFVSLDDPKCNEGNLGCVMNSSSSSLNMPERASEKVQIEATSQASSVTKCSVSSSVAEVLPQDGEDRCSSIASIGGPPLAGIIRSMRQKNPLIITCTDVQRSLACATALLVSGARSCTLSDCTSNFLPALANDADAILMSSSAGVSTECNISDVGSNSPFAYNVV